MDKVTMIFVICLVLGGSVAFYQRKHEGKPGAGTIESLMSETAKVQNRQAEFSLFVPDQLTFKGQAVEQSMAIALITDSLLAKEMMPVESVKKANGRLIRYQPIDLEKLKHMQSQ